MRFLILCLVVTVAFSASALAQDAGVRDTCRYEPPVSGWTIGQQLDDTFSLEMYGWSDQANITGASLGFKVSTDVGGGTGTEDLQIVVDTFVYGPGVNAFIKTFARSSLDPGVPGDHHGYNGCLLGIVNIGVGWMPANTLTKIGDLTLRIQDASQLPGSFQITIDSMFYPPAGTFKYSPSTGNGFPPEFTTGTINVTNPFGGTPEPIISLDPDSLYFTAVQGGANPVDQIITVTNVGEGTLAWTAEDDAAWLTLDPTSGGDGDATTLSVNIAGLTAGTYTGTVTVTDPAANPTSETAKVVLVVTEPPPAIAIDPDSLYFTAVAGGANPTDQSITVTNSGGGVLVWEATDDADWLTLDPTSGGDGDATTLSVDITGLSDGTYLGTVTFTEPPAKQAVEAKVVLVVTPAPPTIALDPDSLTYSAVVDAGNPSAQSITVNNVGGSSLSWTATESIPWASLSTSNGTDGESFDVNVDITGLTPGTYFGTVTVTDVSATNSPQEAKVVLILNDAPPTISLDPDSLYFEAIEGGVNPDAQFVTVFNTGGGSLAWTAAESADWLTLSPTTGTDSESCSAYVDISGMMAGTYTTQFNISDGNATNSPQAAKVVLFIEEAPAVMELVPDSLYFTAEEGAADPASQVIIVNNIGGGTLDWTASDDADWLTLSPTTGSNATPCSLYVDITGLTVGLYNATVTVTDAGADNSPQTAKVVLEITAPPVEPVIALDPTEFYFTWVEGDPAPIPDTLNITNAGTGTLDWTLTSAGGGFWLDFSAVSGTAPSIVELTIDTGPGLTAGNTYYDTIWIASAEAANSPQMAIAQLTVTAPEIPEIDLNPNYFYFTMVEGTPGMLVDTMIVSNIGTGTLNWAAMNAQAWLSLSHYAGGNFDSVFVMVDGSGLAPDIYRDTIWVTDAAASNSPQFAIVDFEVTEAPPLEGDTVFVGTGAGYPGDQVMIPVFFRNVEEISGISVPLTFAGTLKANGITCDSVSFTGSRVEYIDALTGVIDNAAQTVKIGVVVVEESLIPVGYGLMAHMYFSIDPGAAPAIIPIDSMFLAPDNELMYTDDEGQPLYPDFVAGEIEILEAPTPCLAVDTNYFYFEATEGGANPSDQYLGVINCGDVSIDWSVEIKDGIWLSVDPIEGTDDGTVTLSVDITGVGQGSYFDSLAVLSEGADGSPALIHVELYVYPPAPTELCGTVVMPAATPVDIPVPGAIVELMTSHPCGDIIATTITDENGEFCFEDATGDYVLRAYKTGFYPTVMDVTGPADDVLVRLMSTGMTTPTNEWVNLYCDYATYLGCAILPGDVVEAFDPEGVLCGQFFVETDGAYGFMPVYRDDSLTTPLLDEGCDPGDLITVKLNGIDMTPFLYEPVAWTTNGDNIEACFEGQDIIEFCMMLNEGWNLISWNVDTEVDDIDVILADIMQYVEVVLGFELGAMTYDPDLVEFSTLGSMDHLHGYWVKVTEPVEFCVYGMPVDPGTPIPLEAGWNLASYLPNEADSTADALVSIYDDLIIALGFYGAGVTWDPANTGMSDMRHMGPGYGYWLKVSQDVDLIYPSGIPTANYSVESIENSTKISPFANVIPTTRWVDLYGSNVTVDGAPIATGTLVEAVDESGNICGAFRVEASGRLGFMAVYADDALTPDVVEGLSSNSEFRLVIEGVQTEETFTWTSHGDRIEVGSLNSLGGPNVTVPTSYSLKQNYPNPFNPRTTIAYYVADAGNVSLVIYNLLGEQVRTLIDESQDVGEYSIEWDGRDDSGRAVSSGVYFYRLSAGDFNETKKMMLMK